MIDLQKARVAFKNYINQYDNQEDAGFHLKVVHTYHVLPGKRSAPDLCRRAPVKKRTIRFFNLYLAVVF